MFITLGLPSFSPILFAAFRFDVAGAVLLAVALALALRRPRREGVGRFSHLLPRGRAQWVAVCVAAVLNVGMYHALLFYGQGILLEDGTPALSPAVAAVIVGLNPILTTVAARAFLSDERVGAAGVLGLGLGFLGILILASTKPGASLSFFGEGDLLDLDAARLAMLLALGAIASWSLGSTLVRRTRHGMDVYGFTAWQMLLGAALLHVGALLVEGGGRARWDGAGIVSLLYLAVVSSSVGFVIYFTLLERVGPIRANLVSHVAPIFAALASFLWLGFPLEPRAFLAFLLIAGGFGLVARPAGPRMAKA
jgi:drug/metabolite transporter (DMT)-like permease